MRSNIFNNYQYVQIILRIFNTRIKRPSTRAHYLISCSIIKNCMAFRKYLIDNIDHSLSVDELIKVKY